ncbi:hypothetical protein LSH36_922g02123 [Paralvinella palmiformis]|uniref:Uncharacterized protein n=1 Tax=Paralvinella palmiformis TaxID=53620 RepID=A0AAD9IXD1_9ANNE|nr:hypothetical protein LSH36_922g02123 [Paralvinella palmiformis]
MFVGAFDSLFPRGYWLELKTICQLGSLMWLTSSISLMFCRRLNKTEFAGVALALVMIGTFGTALVIGLSTACDTLFAQVYGNANKRHKLGMVLIRSLILITPCAFLPITLYLNAENILIGLHQPREVSRGSAISLTSCYLSYPILTLIYIWISKVYQETWTGYIGETELASQSIIMQIGMYCWLVFLGLSLAGGIRIGHLLGANDPEGASDSCKVLLTVTWFVSGITFVFVCTLKSFLPMIFTNITEIVSMTSSGLGWYAISCLFEGSFVSMILH